MVFELLTLAIAMTFALCFLAIHLYDKTKKAPAVFSIAYACGSAALVTGYLRHNLEPAHATIITNILYTTTMFLTTISIATHYKNKAPVLFMGVIAALQAGILVYYIYWQPDITIRTVTSNVTAAVLIICALLVIPRNSKSLIDKIMFWVVVSISTQFVLRAAILIYITLYNGYVLTDANYPQSLITSSLHFSIAVFSLLLAVTACIAFGMDAIKDVKNIANTDVLSGLLNRRGFEVEARKRIETSQSNKLPLSLIVADLDNFKSVNDKFGHIKGDEVIQVFGEIIQSICKKGDIAARIGGEEFCLMLQTADLNLARLSAETIRQTLESKTFIFKEETFSITASFGAAELKENENFNNLFIRTDEELYNAKHSGRNQVRPKRINYILKSVI